MAYYIIDKQNKTKAIIHSNECIASIYHSLANDNNITRLIAHNRFSVIYTQDNTFNSLYKKYQNFTTL